MRFEEMVQAAEMLSQSTIVPPSYRRQRMVKGKMEDNPSATANVLAAMFAGQDYGWNPMTAMRLMNVIEGKAALKPEAVLGLARKAGHHVEFEIHPDEVTVKGKRADTGDEAMASFSMADAARAGLSHKDVWKKYPEDMMMWRAVAKLGRRLFPDLMLGASYTSEELGGPTDVAELGVPAGPVPVGGSVDMETGELTPPPGWSADIVELEPAPPPSGNLAPALYSIKEQAEAVEPVEETDVGTVITSGDAKNQLLARVAAHMGKDEGDEAAINQALGIWQEEVGLGAKHIDMGEMAAMLARVEAIGTEAF